MRPANLKTKIFLDGGDPNETEAVLGRLGFLDGQTTNPTLIANNPKAKARLARGDKFKSAEVYDSTESNRQTSAGEAYDFYKEQITDISKLVPNGSVSIEVYADAKTTPDAMFTQAKSMYAWIPNAHIKFPIIPSGLASAHRATAEGMRINMTLCFTQEQAMAVHTATQGANPNDSTESNRQTSAGEAYDVFVSPFIGRLDDIGVRGLDLIKNILVMYKAQNSHVKVLTASVRSLDHFLSALHLGSDIITAPAKILNAWADAGFTMPDSSYKYNFGDSMESNRQTSAGEAYDSTESNRQTSAGEAYDLAPIPFEELSLSQNWTDYDINHPLTTKGVEKFASDWNELIE